jgi:hypothetical protein
MSDHRRSLLHGVMGEFETPEDLLDASKKARDAGYKHIDAYTPFPVEGLAKAIGFRWTAVPLITLIGGVAGGLTGFGLQYWCSAITYPINIGGRSLNSWPAFIPVTFELTVLGASIFSVVGMIALKSCRNPIIRSLTWNALCGPPPTASFWSSKLAIRSSTWRKLPGLCRKSMQRM